jgi:hypothetical protein
MGEGKTEILFGLRIRAEFHPAEEQVQGPGPIHFTQEAGPALHHILATALSLILVLLFT